MMSHMKVKSKALHIRSERVYSIGADPIIDAQYYANDIRSN